MKVNFQNSKFIKSAFSKKDHLEDYSQVLFIGKSNVGKSSLINALVGQKNLAYVSKKPGQTKLINYYLIDDKFYLVDAPGFGYRKLSYGKDEFDSMMEQYLVDNKNLRLIVYLVDSRRGMGHEEEEVIDFLNQLNYNFIIVFTKYDKLNQSEKSKLANLVKKLSLPKWIYTSINNLNSIQELQKLIVSYLE